jgi:hypothetical protein
MLPQRLNSILDRHVLHYPVRFLTNRIIILATLTLLVPLIFFTTNQAFVNVLNSYLNVMSVVVSSTVLLYATIADVRDRAAAKRADEIAKAYEQVLEDRIQERADIAKTYEQLLEDRIQERADIAKTYEQLLEDRIQERDNIAKAYEQELEKRVQADHEMIEQILQSSLENTLGARLQEMQSREYRQLEAMQKEVIASNTSVLTELAALRELVQRLPQDHSGASSASNSS